MRNKLKELYHWIMDYLELDHTLPEMTYKEIEDNFKPLSCVKKIPR